jgi:hypothetical protein
MFVNGFFIRVFYGPTSAKFRELCCVNSSIKFVYTRDCRDLSGEVASKAIPGVRMSANLERWRLERQSKLGVGQ